MQKGIDYYPQAAAKLLGKMLMEINLKKDSFLGLIAESTFTEHLLRITYQKTN